MLALLERFPTGPLADDALNQLGANYLFSRIWTARCLTTGSCRISRGRTVSRIRPTSPGAWSVRAGR